MAMLNIMGITVYGIYRKTFSEEAARRTVKFAQGANL
jgi:hypothetical protein